MGNIVKIGKVNATTSINKRKPTAIEPEYIAHIPPPPDEDYWAALLNEGEALSSVQWNIEQHDAVNTTNNDAADNVTFEASQQDWNIAQQAYEADQAVELLINGANRGGLLVEWNSLHGFVPASQLVDFPTIADPQTRRAQLALKIGQYLSLRIIEFDRAQSRLIFSERAAQVLPGTRATVLDSLRHGDILSGWVTNVCDFGVFIDLGGLEGLIHISELSWGRVNHPRDLLTRGDAVQVFVMDINRAQGRVALSLKRMQPDPWETVEQRYRVGEFITGQVTNIVDFGAFICIENGLEGLIHVSELAEGHFLHPRNVVNEGETVRARVLNIDSQARRLGLSLRELINEVASESTVADDSD